MAVDPAKMTDDQLTFGITAQRSPLMRRLAASPRTGFGLAWVGLYDAGTSRSSTAVLVSLASSVSIATTSAAAASGDAPRGAASASILRTCSR